MTGQWDLKDGSSLRGRLEGSYTDEQWTTELYVTNLTDEEQIGNILVGFSLGVSGPEIGQEFITYNSPRQYMPKIPLWRAVSMIK